MHTKHSHRNARSVQSRLSIETLEVKLIPLGTLRPQLAFGEGPPPDLDRGAPPHPLPPDLQGRAGVDGHEARDSPLLVEAEAAAKELREPEGEGPGGCSARGCPGAASSNDSRARRADLMHGRRPVQFRELVPEPCRCVRPYDAQSLWRSRAVRANAH